MHVKEYSPTIWCHNGPSLLTRVFRQASGKEYKCFAPGFTYYGEHLFPVPPLYHIHFSQYRLFSDPIVFETFKDIWNGIYVVHIWNNQVPRKQFIPGDESPMGHLYKNNCPITYSYFVKQGVRE
ncbi:lactosylceramide 4-alpha-galactosyltransferase-like [Tachypleus tridentatus]|uniref:lactosylceramide 4-alpha-galactosyltransferase-like n=1 Tax=Tachypleus tridentatus TaxID=6853 RepID=UPI003FD0B271